MLVSCFHLYLINLHPQTQTNIQIKQKPPLTTSLSHTNPTTNTMPSNNDIIVRPQEPEVLYDALGNKIDIPQRAKKLTSAEERKAKKACMARRKKGEEVFSDEEDASKTTSR